MDGFIYCAKNVFVLDANLTVDDVVQKDYSPLGKLNTLLRVDVAV